MRLHIVFILLLAGAVGACASDDETESVDSSLDEGNGEGDAATDEEQDTDPDAEEDEGGGGSAGAEVPCVDESFGTLKLFDTPSDGEISDEEVDGVFESAIDATAGGLTPTTGYVYARFTEDGLEKLELSDEDAFESTEWHIAFQRYVVRINSGVSGPGNITGARTAPMTDFDELTEVDPELSFRTEEYFTEDCEFVPDPSGIGAPALALGSFWNYVSCVQMNGNVYVVQIAEDQHVKFQVLAYYTLENQETCNETGTVPMPSGAGNMLVKWAFLEN